MKKRSAKAPFIKKALLPKPRAPRHDFPKEILTLLAGMPEGCSQKDIAQKIRVIPRAFDAYKRALMRLYEKGFIVRKEDKRFYLTDKSRAIVTQVGDTFGYVQLQDDEQTRIFVNGRGMMGALVGDEVVINLLEEAEGTHLARGEVVSITQKREGTLGGSLRKEGNEFLFFADSMPRFGMRIDRSQRFSYEQEQKVLGHVVKRGRRHYDHVVHIDHVLGDANLAFHSAQALIEERHIRVDFPLEVEQEANFLSAGGITEEEKKGRLDLRGEKIFTIDSAETKDIDDAVSLKKTEQGWELWVHIADVSHYVKAKSALDEEALLRGTSIYYADQVIPMLPKGLSNGICSLNPGEDRLAFSCKMEIDKGGRLRSQRFYKTIIRSRVKGVYKEINALLKGEASSEILEKYQGLEAMLFQMSDLAATLQDNRMARGSMEFHVKESKILTDQNHRVVDIVPNNRGWSEQIIEEFMLMANEAAATVADEAQIPFVYRVHELPSPEKMAELKSIALRLALPGAGTLEPTISAKEFSLFLKGVEGTKYERLIHSLSLRSLAKARYDTKELGHYSLALTRYAHFTSPIRRYPDLSIHRILTAYLIDKQSQEKMNEHFSGFAEASAKHSSEAEVAAMQLERDCEDVYKAEYLQKHLGEEYVGIISTVLQSGFFVELENSVEGFVPVTTLPGEEYIYDERIALVNPVTGMHYTVGDTVHIRVESANVSAGRIDFSLV